MAVTEFALLSCKAGEITQPLKQELEAALAIQQEWSAKHVPHFPSTQADRKTALFQQTEDPSNFIITDIWESVASHHQWIASDENKKVMTGLADHVASDKVTVFHLDAEIFKRPGPEGTIGLTESPVVSVARFFLTPDNKKSFAGKFDRVTELIGDSIKPHLARGGWRVDKEDEDKEEYVLFCGWDSLESHTKFSENPGFPEYRETLQFVSGVEVMHLTRLM